MTEAAPYQPECPSGTPEKITTKWWLGSIFVPPVFIGIGIGIAVCTHVSQGDMIGILPILCIVASMTVGYLLSIVCTVLSFRKGEGWSGLAIVFTIGYSIAVLCAWFG